MVDDFVEWNKTSGSSGKDVSQMTALEKIEYYKSIGKIR